MTVNTVYYFSDPHPLIVEVNGMGWEVGREGGRNEDFTGINRSGVGKAGERLLKYFYEFWFPICLKSGHVKGLKELLEEAESPCNLSKKSCCVYHPKLNSEVCFFTAFLIGAISSCSKSRTGRVWDDEVWYVYAEAVYDEVHLCERICCRLQWKTFLSSKNLYCALL